MNAGYNFGAERRTEIKKKTIGSAKGGLRESLSQIS